MGILERRSMQKLIAETLPARSAEIEEICGKAIPYEVDEASFASAEAQTIDFVDNISCHRLNMALRSICVDDLGKEAVCSGLTRVRLSHTGDNSCTLEFSDGVLVMKNDYLQRTYSSDSDIRDLLCSKL